MTATTDLSPLGDRAGFRPSVKPMVAVIDRWIYVFMAAFFILIVLVGFIPDSLQKVAAVKAGQRPPFPIIMHVHAALMGAFLLTLLGQTLLVATGRRKLHQELGVFGFTLAGALVVVGSVLAPTMYHQVAGGLQVAPPEAQGQIRSLLALLDNILLLQMRIGVLFPAMLLIGFFARRTDPGLHKRMMILAVAATLPAAFDRMAFWLPNTLPQSPLASDFYVLAAAAPMLIWDVIRTGAVPRAYLIAGGLYLIASIPVHLLWDGAWWHAAVPKLMGV